MRPTSKLVTRGQRQRLRSDDPRFPAVVPAGQRGSYWDYYQQEVEFDRACAAHHAENDAERLRAAQTKPGYGDGRWLESLIRDARSSN